MPIATDFYYLISEIGLIRWAKRSLKKIVPAYLIGRIVIFMKESNSRNHFYQFRSKNEKHIYMFFCPDYGNLGDVGIYLAQMEFLASCLPEYELVEIPVAKTLDGIAWFRQKTTKGDLVVLSGGGFFGDLYPLMEVYRQLIVGNFNSVPIVSFPQSIFFSDTQKGCKLLHESRKTYSNHPDLTLIGRDLISYHFIMKNFPCCSHFCLPDIVLSMQKSDQNDRKGVVFCWRQDFESGVLSTDKSLIESAVKPGFKSAIYTDTRIASEDFSVQNLMVNYHRLIQTFRSAELVVTDRLHGMLFCYQTNTPCLIVNDKNSKVVNFYHTWLREVPYLKLFDPSEDISEIHAFTEAALSGTQFDKTSMDFREYFDELKELIVSKVKSN